MSIPKIETILNKNIKISFKIVKFAYSTGQNGHNPETGFFDIIGDKKQVAEYTKI